VIGSKFSVTRIVIDLMRLPYFPLLLLFTFCIHNSFAQERCAQVVHEKMLHGQGLQKREEAFEKWIKNKIESGSSTLKNGRTQAGPYIIPVVVHVIHNGESVGNGTNISDAQILSQIDVLNEDYQRNNADKINTPAEFELVAGSLDIQFVLAKQDPNGLPTNGIKRVKGTKSGWAISDEKTFKALSYWPAESYLNIWVIHFSDNFIGFAQLPLKTGTNLSGLDDSSTDRLTDGVVVDSQTFGSSFNGFGSFNLLPAYNHGRTATHEIGHFFGLRHTWGDTNCGTDYVSDTPPQQTSTTNCPSHPAINTCNGESVAKMFQNYMDYTNDVCMNLFTQGQVQRMDIVINNSPRRASLLTSIGATTPNGPPITDLSLESLRSPGPVICTLTATPTVTIVNKGTTVISNFQIETAVNDGSVGTKSFTSLQFLPYQEMDFTLPQLNLKNGVNTLSFIVTNPNGQADDNISNNLLTVNEVVNESTDVIPLRENFDSDFSDWTIVSPPNNLNWQSAKIKDNTSLAYGSFTNTNKGQEAWLVSPVLDFSLAPQASVLFDVSYATRSTGVERLQIFSSTDCGLTYSETQYDRIGSEFSSGPSPISWQPSLESDWQKDFADLSDLAGEENVRLAFVITNENGNNMYLDNLEFYISNNSNPPEVGSPYYVYASSSRLDAYNITFNLVSRADVQLYVYDLLGQKVAEQFLPNALNQTYPIEFANEVSGIYIIRLKIGNELSSTKIFVGR
jgi:hypothetical protein